jgi:hypothetical protein
MAPVTFCTLADERFFIGAACLVNSLGLTGNTGDIALLDLGLSADQRARLEPHVRLVDLPEELRGEQMLYKCFPHLLGVEGTVVVIDSDMIVTRSLDPILERAAAGEVCLFADIADQRSRFFSEWREVFQLRAPLRRGQHYLNAGFIAFSTEHWPDLLRRYWETCQRIPAGTTLAVGAEYDQPFWGGDQDAINALLMSEVDGAAVTELPQAEGPSADLLTGVRVDDVRTLACSLRGHRPYLLHYWGGPKPWASSAWMRVRRNAYVKFMPRVLLAPDVRVRISPDELPPWLRPGRAGAAELRALDAMNAVVRTALALAPKRARGVITPLRARLTR